MQVIPPLAKMPSMPNQTPSRRSLRRLCPVCGDQISISGKTTDGRVIGSCGAAFPSRSRAENLAVGPSAVKKTNAQLGREVDEALRRHHRAGHARKLKPKTRHEIQKTRLAMLRARMEDALGDIAWRDTDLYEIEKWISVDAELSDREWLKVAQEQLLNESVLPEHAGAPPPNVYAWNDVFISTYRMNIDDSMNREEAIDSARQNAFDTVKLSTNELSMIKSDPKLYEEAP